jgi:hypothetical protein
METIVLLPYRLLGNFKEQTSTLLSASTRRDADSASGGGVSVPGSTVLGAAEAVPAVIAAKISASTHTIRARRKVTFMPL